MVYMVYRVIVYPVQMVKRQVDPPLYASKKDKNGHIVCLVMFTFKDVSSLFFLCSLLTEG